MKRISIADSDNLVATATTFKEALVVQMNGRNLKAVELAKRAHVSYDLINALMQNGYDYMIGEVYVRDIAEALCLSETATKTFVGLAHTTLKKGCNAKGTRKKFKTPKLHKSAPASGSPARINNAPTAMTPFDLESVDLAIIHIGTTPFVLLNSDKLGDEKVEYLVAAVCGKEKS